ncbi:MAG: HEAT repeat domain-containing protein [Desulfuromonadaceae bacterium]|nr:HEAT repeat domain-containing protein [Desulfuromonadaceae bacterium]MDD2849420.1 HEAT repeat domain-containing protein [Desulfuromonadaceae bacterium]MDD4130012.1 HEAT repeat domain-containing protein [Desulfuromonadaceae bacterium]
MKEMARSRIELLRPLLKDPVADVRTAAAEAIERLEAASSVDEILATLKTGNNGARIGAIYALGEIGGERVLPPLVYCAKRPEVDIRSVATAVLGKLALPAALPILVELLDDIDPTVQGWAIAGLRNFQVTPDILNKLRPFLNASDGVLEAEAAITLSWLNDLYSLVQINELLTSHYASSRQAAAIALSRMSLQ